jgi:hypothetical protein
VWSLWQHIQWWPHGSPPSSWAVLGHERQHMIHDGTIRRPSCCRVKMRRDNAKFTIEYPFHEMWFDPWLRIRYCKTLIQWLSISSIVFVFQSHSLCQFFFLSHSFLPSLQSSSNDLNHRTERQQSLHSQFVCVIHFLSFLVSFISHLSISLQQCSCAVAMAVIVMITYDDSPPAGGYNHFIT